MNSKDDVLGPINLGNPNEISMLELASLIKDYCGVEAELQFLPCPEDDPKKRKPDIDLAKTILGWQPTTSLEKGLKETLAYFQHKLGFIPSYV